MFIKSASNDINKSQIHFDCKSLEAICVVTSRALKPHFITIASLVKFPPVSAMPLTSMPPLSWAIWLVMDMHSMPRGSLQKRIRRFCIILRKSGVITCPLAFPWVFCCCFPSICMLQWGEFFQETWMPRGRRQIYFAVKPRFLMSTVLTLGLCVVLFQKQLPGEKFHLRVWAGNLDLKASIRGCKGDWVKHLEAWGWAMPQGWQHPTWHCLELLHATWPQKDEGMVLRCIFWVKVRVKNRLSLM